MADYDDLNNKRIFGVAILSVVVVAVTALAVQVLYFWMVRIQEDHTASMSSYARSSRVLSEQSAEIADFGVDESTGNLKMPIEKAIELVVTKKSEGETQTHGDDEA